MAEVAIVVPAHNEALRIGPTLTAFCEYFGERASIAVVLNGCSDDTRAIVAQSAKHYSNLTIIDIGPPVGKGGAVRIGLMVAEQPYAGFVDADGSYTPAEFDRLLTRCAAEKLDGVIGMRDPREWRHMPGISRARRIASAGFKLLCRALFGLPFTDTQCGAKVFRRDALAPVLDDLELANFAFDVDLLHRLHKNHARVRELSIRWQEKSGSKVDVVRTALSMLRAIVRLRIRRSWLGNVPFVDLLGRQSVIAVVAELHVLLLGDASSRDRLAFTCRLEECLRMRGVRVERVPKREARVSLGVSFWDRVRFWFWYVFRTDRRYDALVEVASPLPYLLPWLSVKRTFVALRSRGAAGFVYEHLYALRRRVEFHLDPQIDTLAAAIENGARSSGLHAARLFRVRGKLTLAYTDEVSGQQREQPIPL